jgi:hypothetical protein
MQNLFWEWFVFIENLFENQWNINSCILQKCIGRQKHSWIPACAGMTTRFIIPFPIQ